MSFLTTKHIGMMLTVLAAQGVLAANQPQQEEPTYSVKSYSVPHARGLVRTKESTQWIRNAPHVAFPEAATSVPKTYSLRGKAGPVEDQGQCGSCWDFSLTTVLRGSWIVAGKDPGRLSFNYLLNCATTMQGCNGGDFPAADMFISPKGAPAYGTDGEYTQANGTCIAEKAVASTVSYKLLGTDMGANPTGAQPSFRDIAYIVGVLHQPVSIDVAADDNWEGYSGGVYNACSDQKAADINHMVVIEGYDCETAVDSTGHCTFDAKGNLPHGVGTWLIRNSWGTDWGDDGYITTKATDKNGVACNMAASDALYYDVTGK